MSFQDTDERTHRQKVGTVHSGGEREGGSHGDRAYYLRNLLRVDE